MRIKKNFLYSKMLITDLKFDISSNESVEDVTIRTFVMYIHIYRVNIETQKVLVSAYNLTPKREMWLSRVRSIDMLTSGGIQSIAVTSE